MHQMRSESLDHLFDAILSLKDREDCYKFFDDICTIKEVLDMAQRFDVAILLDQGVSYQAIAQRINVSTATISRVSRCLNYGSGGYRVALDRIGEGKV